MGCTGSLPREWCTTCFCISQPQQLKNGNHVKDRLLDHAQARRAPYPPPPVFWGHSHSIPQSMISDVSPLVQSSFRGTKVSPNAFFNFDPSTPPVPRYHFSGGGWRGDFLYMDPPQPIAGGTRPNSSPPPPPGCAPPSEDLAVFVYVVISVFFCGKCTQQKKCHIV